MRSGVRKKVLNETFLPSESSYVCVIVRVGASVLTDGSSLVLQILLDSDLYENL